jgi:hypothetical protein
MFEKRVFRRIFRPRRDEVTGSWRKLQNLYPSPNIVRVIKSRRMRWVVMWLTWQNEKCIQNVGWKF